MESLSRSRLDALVDEATVELARDFIDIDAALQSGRCDRETVLNLAERADSGFDRRMFADAVGQAQVLDDDDFAEYGIGVGQHNARAPGSRHGGELLGEPPQA